MLSAGVAEAVLKFLKSEMPPVQFKLLGTLRMLIDAQGKISCFLCWTFDPLLTFFFPGEEKGLKKILQIN